MRRVRLQPSWRVDMGLAGVLLVGTLVALILLAPMFEALAAERFTAAKRHHYCRYATATGGPSWNRTDVRKLIDCATDHFPVPGGDAKAMYIANRESGFNCKARNGATLPLGRASGVYQILYTGIWFGAPGTDGWWDRHGMWLNAHGWGLHKPNVLGCRPNVLVAIRQVHTSGSWGPWGG